MQKIDHGMAEVLTMLIDHGSATHPGEIWEEKWSRELLNDHTYRWVCQ